MRPSNRGTLVLVFFVVISFTIYTSKARKAASASVNRISLDDAVVRAVLGNPLLVRPIASRRFYLLYIPRSLLASVFQETSPAPVLYVFHGMRVNATWAALNETQWRDMAEKNRIIVAFMQSKVMNNLTRWDFHSMDDLEYVEKVAVDVETTLASLHLKADPTRVYGLGISNGGFFVINLAIRFPRKFVAICNYMGGYNDRYMPELDPSSKPVPMIVVVGGADAMMAKSRKAEQVWRDAGGTVEFLVSPGVGHKYEPKYEQRIWHFFSSYHWDPPPHVQT